MTLRIIGGTLRRRLLTTPHGLTTRPYTDRVRQIVFDRIGASLEQARVADIFSGVGTMGLESLSRGAASCVFFEADRQVFASLKENVDLLAGDFTTVCWKTNVHRTSFRPKGCDGILPYSVVFLDPPYAQCSLLERGQPLAKALTRLARPEVTSGDVTLVLRTQDRFDLPALNRWMTQDCWHLSSMKIWLLRKAPDEHETPHEATLESNSKADA
ncbi:MAG: RsmD family RNA methyltransferase [Planctomycetaceae bacterium]